MGALSQDGGLNKDESTARRTDRRAWRAGPKRVDLPAAKDIVRAHVVSFPWCVGREIQFGFDATKSAKQCWRR